ncbi:MAG: aquaporin [Gammaproteobacteria bacterium]
MTALSKKIFSEFLGTAALVGVVVGSGIMAENLASGNIAIALLANALATFWGLYFLITCLGQFSAHFNPAVSLIFFIKKDLDSKTFLYFIIFQTLGAICGALLANAMFDLDIFQISEKLRTGSNLWLSEGVATAGLILIILLSPKEKTAIMVASYIGAAYWFTSSTSFANPAVTIGRVFSDTFTGIEPYSAMYFILYQLIGALIGFVIFTFLRK